MKKGRVGRVDRGVQVTLVGEGVALARLTRGLRMSRPGLSGGLGQGGFRRRRLQGVTRLLSVGFRTRFMVRSNAGVWGEWLGGDYLFFYVLSLRGFLG